MNWFDLTLIGILTISVVVSLFRGLIREVLSLLIWVGAFWVAWTFVDNGATVLTPYIELPSARHLIAFVALFLAALIIGGLINYLVGTMVKRTGLGASDRFFGAFFGLARGVVAITALVLFLKATPFSQDPWWEEAKLQPHFSKLADWVKKQMPEELSAYFNFINPEQLQKTLLPEVPGQSAPEPGNSSSVNNPEAESSDNNEATASEQNTKDI